MMKKKYMKQVGHADAQMFFYVDSAEELEAKLGGNVKVIAEEPYYRYIPKSSLKLSTKVSMAVSDQFKDGKDDLFKSLIILTQNNFCKCKEIN